MLKALFTRGLAKAVALILYLGSGGLWLGGVVSNHPRPLFYAAGLLLACAYLWTLGWIWMHPMFRKSKRSLARRYSDHLRSAHSDVRSVHYARAHPERRKRRLRSGKRKLRWASLAGSALVFSAIGAEFVTSYQNEIGKTEQMRLQVYLMDADKTRTRAMIAPSIQGSASREMTFALVGIPTREVKIRSSDRSMVVNVVVRNSGDLEIENAHILISSSVPIKPASADLATVSDTELRAEVDDLPAFRRTGSETVFPVEIPIPEYRVKAGLLVTVLGEGMRPYSAAAKVLIMKQANGAVPVSAAQTAGQ